MEEIFPHHEYMKERAQAHAELEQSSRAGLQRGGEGESLAAAMRAQAHATLALAAVLEGRPYS